MSGPSGEPRSLLDDDADGETARLAYKEMESELAKAKDGRLQERFGVILAALIVFDVWAFSGMETWTAPLAILIVELFLIIVVARACGIEDIVELVSSIVKSIGDRAGKH